MHFDFPERMCMYQSLSLSLSIYICKNVLDPDQTRMEFRKECFVNLKNCACDRKYAKCRTKADAHDKMGFQYISISVYIVRSHARIQRGGQGVRTPLKNHKKYRISKQYWTGSPGILKTTKPAFNVGPSSARQRNAI